VFHNVCFYLLNCKVANLILYILERKPDEFGLVPDNEGYVKIKLYDGIGREILTINEANYSRGTHEVSLDVSSLQNGNYYYQVQSEDKQMMKTLVVAK
jgi:flagellar hook assembly protein FlgD